MKDSDVWGLVFLHLWVSTSYVWGLVLLWLGVKDSYVWGLVFLHWRSDNILRLGVSCLTVRG